MGVGSVAKIGLGALGGVILRVMRPLAVNLTEMNSHCLAPIGETLAGAGAQHAVTVSVRDSAALLDILAGGEPGDPYAAPAAAGSFFAATRRPPGKLRIAFMRKPVGGASLDPQLIAAAEATAKGTRKSPLKFTTVPVVKTDCISQGQIEKAARAPRPRI